MQTMTATQPQYQQQQIQQIQQPIQQQQPTQVIIQQQPAQQVMMPSMGDDPTMFYIMIGLTWFILGPFSVCLFCCADPVLPNQPSRIQARKFYWISYAIMWLIAIIVSISTNV